MSVNKFGQSKTGKPNMRGPPGAGFKLTEDGNFDLDNKRILNIELLPKEQNEVSSKGYVDLNRQSILDELKDFDSKCATRFDNIEAKHQNDVNEIQVHLNEFKNLYTQEIYALRKTYKDAYDDVLAKLSTIHNFLENNRGSFKSLQTKIQSVDENQKDLSRHVNAFISTINTRLIEHKIQPVPVFHTVE